MNTYKYTLTHSHDEGITQFNIETNINIFAQNWYGDPDQLERLAEECGINYEPHKGETLELSLMDETMLFLSRGAVERILGNNS